MAMAMARALPLLTTLTVVLLLLLGPSLARAQFDFNPFGPGSSPNTTPSNPVLSNLKSTIDQLRQLISTLSTFAGGFAGGDVRTSAAVQDCMDLLDLSADELTWTVSSTQGYSASAAAAIGGGTTGKRAHDLQSWLSAALGNQDTCAESLDGTNLIVKSLVLGSMSTVTNVIAGVLGQMPDLASGGGSGGGGRKLLGSLHGGFPSWVGAAERKLLQETGGVGADAVVAADGTGNYLTVTEAVDAAPQESGRRYVIYVKRGVYKENVDVKKKKWNILMIGDGMGATVISGSRNFVDGWTTFRSATFAVSGKGFIARDITFENTAGPEKHQAVALRSDSDLSVFFRCEFRGYQDTLYAHSLRQFFRECRISGTVDFIFGDAAAVFQSCQILARKPLANQKNSVTAQGRKDPNQNTGFSFQYSNVTADSDLAGSNQTTLSFLGRPWKEYSRTVFMQSYMSDVIRPEGWLEWNGDFALSTLYYGEYMNYGPGSVLDGRVKWPGYHAFNSTGEAANFTVAQFIDGNSWLPSTGVRYTAGFRE